MIALWWLRRAAASKPCVRANTNTRTSPCICYLRGEMSLIIPMNSSSRQPPALGTEAIVGSDSDVSQRATKFEKLQKTFDEHFKGRCKPVQHEVVAVLVLYWETSDWSERILQEVGSFDRRMCFKISGLSSSLRYIVGLIL